jgi:hypothetical protein
MKKANTVVSLASLSLMFMLATTLAAMDPEERVAEEQPLLAHVQNIYERLWTDKGKPEDSLKRLAAASVANPGTNAAAIASYHTAKYYLKVKNYNDFVTASGKFLELKSALESKNIDMLSYLTALLNNSNVSPETKNKAFSLVSSRMDKTPACWSGVSAYLKKQAFDNANKYDLACRCAEVAGGKKEETQLQLWELLKAFSAQESQDLKVKMYERYLKICGENGDVTSAPEECLAQLLEWRSKAGDVAAERRLKELKDKQMAEQAAVNKEADSIIALLGKGQLDDAGKAIRALKMKPTRLNDEVCQRVATSKPFEGVDLARRMELATAMMDVMQGDKIAGKIYQQFHLKYTNDEDDQARYLALFDSYIINGLSTPNWIIGMTRYFVTRTESLTPKLRIRLRECLTHGQEKFGLSDLLAQGLLKKAEEELDTDMNTAIADLEAVMKKCPQTPEAAKAEWLRDLLTGKGKIVQGPLPRTSNYFTSEYSPSFKLNGVFGEKPYCVIQPDMGISPCAPIVFDMEKIQADGDKGTVGNAFDAKPDTSWTPGRAQSSVQIPFKSLVSIGQISIHAAGTPNYLVTLLDRDGKPLWEGERCLNLHGCSDIQTVPESVIMNLLPVDNVAYLRINIYADSPGDGIAEVSVKGPKYQALQIDTFEAQKIPSGAGSVFATWTSDGQPLSHELSGDQENVNGYPFSRWRKPWDKKKALSIAREGGNLGISFFGDKATLLLTGKGGVIWRLDGGKSNRIEKNDEALVDGQKKVKESAKEYSLAEELEPGIHRLQLKSFKLPSIKDKYSPADAIFNGLLINGTPTAFPVIRFETAGKWSEWFRLANGKAVSIPAGASRSQTGVVFDQRSVEGMGAATMKKLEVKYENSAGERAKPFSIPGALPSSFETVVKELKERKLTVVYSKTGTKEEYEAAKRLAEKAGVYLVSDDKQLNDYAGDMLAIGTVLNNRYNRQLLARENIFANADFLNGGVAWCGTATDAAGKADFHFICGPDSASVVAMADKVAAGIPQWRGPEAAFRLFSASTLERIYPWMLGTASPEERELKITMGRNDRRNTQIGIAFDRTADDIETTCSALKDQDGHSLPSPKIRYVGFYEWVPFFGDLRLPDLLVEKPLLPIPANTATGIWLTFSTANDTVPGEYRGELSMRVGKQIKKVPITVSVLPVTVPNGEDSSFYSYSVVPYWWHLGSPNYNKALERLYRNEAEHKLTMVFVDPEAFTWHILNGSVVFDFAPLMQEMDLAERIYKEAGMPQPKFFGSPTPGKILMNILSSQGQKPDTESLNKISTEYAAQLTAQLKKTGRWARYYQKAGDEPGDVAKWVAAATPYKKGGLKIHTTTGFTNKTEKERELAVGTMDAWCPNYEHDVFLPFLKERRKAGDELWWYMCTCPSTRITGQLHDTLAFYWLTAKWDFAGGHSYGGLCPPSSGPEATGIPFRYDHGLAFRMLFLPDGTLIDSPRREMESEGVIDCLLIKAAQKRIRELSGAKAEEYSSRLDGILHGVVPYKRGYAETVTQWEKARAALYRLLVDMK